MITGGGVVASSFFEFQAMKKNFESIYELMLAELKECQCQDLSEADRAEGGYRVALEYWHLVKQKFQRRVMQVDEEEIGFFREIKPRFTAYIEYNLILHQALLFIPESECDRSSYWQEELHRYERYCDRHHDFIAYYESGARERFCQYYLQRSNTSALSPQERIYEDEDCRSSHDHLVRGLLANRMYREYVQERLKQLQDRTPNG